MKDKKTQLKKVNWNDLAILLILVVLVVILAFIRPVFLTPNNLLNIMRQVSIVAILGIGMTYVLISAEIDLSVGSLVALSGVVVAMMLKSGVPIPISILAGSLVIRRMWIFKWSNSYICKNTIIYCDNGNDEYCKRNCTCNHKLLPNYRTARFF